MAAIEQEALIQLEVRRQKFTSDEAVQRSRLAVKRRVAAKLEREAQKAREAEEAEAERAKKMQQVRFSQNLYFATFCALYTELSRLTKIAHYASLRV